MTASDLRVVKSRCQYFAVWSASMMALASTIGCAGPAPMKVTVPPEVVSLLSGTGLPVGELETTFFSRFNSTNRQVGFNFEAEFAPQMVMVRIPPDLAANADGLIDDLVNDKIAPLETDIAVCKHEIVRGNEVLLEPDRNGRFEMPKLEVSLPNFLPPYDQIPSGSIFQLARSSGTLTALSIRPPPAGTSSDLDITATISNPSVDIAIAGIQYTLSATSLTLTCSARAFAPRPSSPGFLNPCGEIEVKCITQAISYTGIAFNHPVYGQFPALTIIEGIATSKISDAMTSGIVLHFEHFVGSGLGTVTDPVLGLVLKLTGDGSPNVAVFCSPTAEPEPPPAPTRGLVSVATSLGAGELIGSKGDVIPFDLVPEIEVEWEHRPQSTNPFLSPFLPMQPIEPPSVGLGRNYGSEFDFRTEVLAGSGLGFKLSAELIKRVPRNCFRKPLDLTEALAPAFPPGATQGRPGAGCLPGECGCITCLSGAAFFIELTAADGSTTLTRDLRTLDGIHLGYPSLSGNADFIREVAPRLTRIDGNLCPGRNCPSTCNAGTCQPWTRLQIPFSPPSGPRGPGVPGPPWAIALWAGPSLQSRVLGLIPAIQPVCGKLQPAQEIVGERILTAPSVTFWNMMADSAEFSSARLSGGVSASGIPIVTGITDSPTNGQFGRIAVSTATQIGTRIEFTPQCPTHPLGQAHLPSPCWVERVDLPSLGNVFVSNNGHSDTRVPRVPLSTALTPLFAKASAADYGSRRTAVQGVFDRSALRVFTAVPKIYNTIGLTQSLTDYRGQVFLDWEHGSAFPAPGGSLAHAPKANRPRWRGFNFSYFADWRADRFSFLSASDTPKSFCLRDDQKFAVPGDLIFSGARLPNQVTVTPAQYLLPQIPGLETQIGVFPGPFP